MIILNNIQALNAIRLTNNNAKEFAKSTSRVSSGYRIMRAADDPAGLSLSEKMRRQIRGLNKGVENAKEAVNLCKIADGALNEVTDIIQRLNKLAVQAANGTESDTDRHFLQQEADQLIKEIDRIADTTLYNGLAIFKGNEAVDSDGTTVTKPSTSGDFFKLFGDSISKTGYMQEALKPGDVTQSTSTLNNGNPYVSVHIDMGKLNNIKDLSGTTFFVNCCTNCCPTTVNFTDDVGVTLTNTPSGKNSHELNIGLKKPDGSYYSDPKEFCKYMVDALCEPQNDISHVEFGYKDSVLYIYDVDNNAWSQGEKEQAYFCDMEIGTVYPPVPVGIDEELWIQSGCEYDSGLWLTIGRMNTELLSLSGYDVTTVESAGYSITRAKNALQAITENRSNIGAQQNRLEHTIYNEENIIEKLESSEANIRDTDISSEMINFTNLNIVLKAGHEMIAEANKSIEKLLTILQ